VIEGAETGRAAWKNQEVREFGGKWKISWTNGSRCHIEYGMKMTMHIDEDLLKRVMADYDYESKTEAVEMALRELDRKTRFRRFGTEGLGLTSEEWKDAIFPGYDPKNLSVYDPLSSKVAEDPTNYGK
jgi:Arc/MetJ family transcription regulator